MDLERERQKERARDAMTNAVELMIEAGFTRQQITEECEYALETSDV